MKFGKKLSLVFASQQPTQLFEFFGRKYFADEFHQLTLRFLKFPPPFGSDGVVSADLASDDLVVAF